MEYLELKSLAKREEVLKENFPCGCTYEAGTRTPLGFLYFHVKENRHGRYLFPAFFMSSEDASDFQPEYAELASFMVGSPQQRRQIEKQLREQLPTPFKRAKIIWEDESKRHLLNRMIQSDFRNLTYNPYDMSDPEGSTLIHHFGELFFELFDSNPGGAAKAGLSAGLAPPLIKAAAARHYISQMKSGHPFNASMIAFDYELGERYVLEAQNYYERIKHARRSRKIIRKFLWLKYSLKTPPEPEDFENQNPGDGKFS